MADFINGLVAQYKGSKTEILCISHGGTYIFGLPELLPNLSFDLAWEQGLGHTDIIVAEEKDGRLICRSWGKYTFA